MSHVHMFNGDISAYSPQRLFPSRQVRAYRLASADSHKEPHNEHLIIFLRDCT
jgi:hypothetical protein